MTISASFSSDDRETASRFPLPIPERNVMSTTLACFCRSLTLAVTATVAVAPTFAQETPDLAKQAQNPVAHLISVPFQNNFNFGVGPRNDLQDVLNIQP